MLYTDERYNRLTKASKTLVLQRIGLPKTVANKLAGLNFNILGVLITQELIDVGRRQMAKTGSTNIITALLTNYKTENHNGI